MSTLLSANYAAIVPTVFATLMSALDASYNATVVEPIISTF
jgi:hypothetical protein